MLTRTPVRQSKGLGLAQAPAVNVGTITQVFGFVTKSSGAFSSADAETLISRRRWWLEATKNAHLPVSAGKSHFYCQEPYYRSGVVWVNSVYSI
jgi:hypothetical protein